MSAAESLGLETIENQIKLINEMKKLMKNSINHQNENINVTFKKFIKEK